MRRLFIFMMITLLTFGLSINEASAKRFGGGGGFGMMRSKSLFNQSARVKRTPTASNPAKSSRWRGALSGLLLGSLLTSLFMGHGLGGALFSWFFIGIIIYLVINFVRRRTQTNPR